MNSAALEKSAVVSSLLYDVDVNILAKETGSTNTTARKLFFEANRPVLVATTWQEGGRGTRGRSFFGCEGGGLYMSIAMKPAFSKEYLAFATPAVAVAVSKAIKDVCGVETKIKWVNDITVSDKKLCGILCESSLDCDGQPEVIVVGVGANLMSGNLPRELKDTACALDEMCERCDISKLCAEITNNVFGQLSSIEAKGFLFDYREKSSLLGRRVKFELGDTVFRGTAIEIDDEAQLIVTGDDGAKHTLQFGDVSVRPDEVY